MAIPSWLYISQTAGTSGTTVITVSAGTNSNAIIYGLNVTTDYDNKEVIISQKQGELVVNPESIKYIPSSGGTYTISVSSNTSWNVTYPNWIIGNATGSGNQIITINVSINSGSTTRDGNILITNGTINRYVNISQKPSVTEPDYSNDYFTIIAESSGRIYLGAEKEEGSYYSAGLNMYYQKNGGSWYTIFADSAITSYLTVENGDIIKFRVYPNQATGGHLIVDSRVSFSVRGNIMSTVYSDWSTNPQITTMRGTFNGMFGGNTGLTDAKYLVLPATTLTNKCYYMMFMGCNSLQNAPTLPATTLTEYAYAHMFNGCTSLNYVKCLATDKNATNCTYWWLHSVSSSGTFVKAAGVTWPSGDSGIPNNWTVQEV